MLSATGFFNCLNNNFLGFFPRKIGNRKVCDRLATACLGFRIERNLANLYRYPWRATINDSNFSIPSLFFGQIAPPLYMLDLCLGCDDFKASGFLTWLKKKHSVELLILYAVYDQSALCLCHIVCGTLICYSQIYQVNEIMNTCVKHCGCKLFTPVDNFV